MKATVFFRGREMAHPEIGHRILMRLLEELAEVAQPETMPRQEGNQMHTILTGKKGAPKPRRRRQPRSAEAEGEEVEELAKSQWRRIMKLKTHAGAAKRFKKTGTGKIVRASAFKRHILTSKTTKSKRHMRGTDGRHARLTPASCTDASVQVRAGQAVQAVAVAVVRQSTAGSYEVRRVAARGMGHFRCDI